MPWSPFLLVFTLLNCFSPGLARVFLLLVALPVAAVIGIIND